MSHEDKSVSGVPSVRADFDAGGQVAPGAVETIAFLAVAQFSMLAFFSAVEPLRVANRLAGRVLYRWQVASVDGAPVTSSNGMSIPAEPLSALETTPRALFVCAGFDPEHGARPEVLAYLRRLDSRGVQLGALDSGCYLLAAAGLLDGYRVTMHWESAPAFIEQFPRVTVINDLFEYDRRRVTCAGGTAALDMMLHRIAATHGRALAVAVSEQFVLDRIRNRVDHQRTPLAVRLGVDQPCLLRVVAAMESHLEQPLDTAALVAIGGVSRRQLERLFRSHLGCTPSAWYLDLRLNRARELLRHTTMRVLEVALACGFQSAPHFTRAYRNRFGRPPGRDRRPGDSEGRLSALSIAPRPDWQGDTAGDRRRGSLDLSA